MMKMLFIVMTWGALWGIPLLGVEKPEKTISKYAPRLGCNILNKDVESAKGLAMLRLGGLLNPKNNTFLLAMAYLEKGSAPKASEKVDEKKFLAYVLKRAEELRRKKSGKDKILALTYYKVLQTFDYDKDKVLLGIMKLKVSGVEGELNDLLNQEIKAKPKTVVAKKDESEPEPELGLVARVWNGRLWVSSSEEVIIKKSRNRFMVENKTTAKSNKQSLGQIAVGIKSPIRGDFKFSLSAKNIIAVGVFPYSGADRNNLGWVKIGSSSKKCQFSRVSGKYSFFVDGKSSKIIDFGDSGDEVFVAFAVANGKRADISDLKIEQGSKVGAIKFGKNYYKRIPLQMSWADAKAYCESVGGHLATITSKRENDFIYKNWGQVHSWIGATVVSRIIHGYSK